MSVSEITDFHHEVNILCHLTHFCYEPTVFQVQFWARDFRAGGQYQILEVIVMESTWL